MGDYKLRILASAQKEFDALPFPLRRQVNQSLCALRGEPRPRDCEPIGSGGRCRLRVHRYRVLYRIDDASGIVSVYAIRQPGEI